MKIKIIDGTVQSGDKTFKVGDVVDLKDGEAQRLVRLGVAEVPEVIVESKEVPPSRMSKDELQAALTELKVEFGPDEKRDDLIAKLVAAKAAQAGGGGQS